MRRVGPRGSGEFERISWDEALDEIAAQLLRVRETYGNAAILDGSRSGNTSILHNRNTTLRFLNLFGGCTEMWSNMSAEAEVFSVRTTFGDKVGYKAAGREPTDYVNSKLIIMWGWSPGDGTFGTGTMQYLKHAKERGVRIICVDPRRHRTSQALADEHIFIRPRYTAALLAMAYIIVTEDLHDQAFLTATFRASTRPLYPRAPNRDRPGRPTFREVDSQTPEWASEIAAFGGRHSPSCHRLRNQSQPPPAACTGARSMASISIAPPMASPRLPAASVKLAAIPASRMGRPAVAASAIFLQAKTRSSATSRPRFSPTFSRKERRGAIRLTSN